MQASGRPGALSLITSCLWLAGRQLGERAAGRLVAALRINYHNGGKIARGPVAKEMRASHLAPPN